MRLTEALPRSLRPVFDFLKGAPSILNESEEVVTGAATADVDPSVYKTEVITGGTAGAENLDPKTGTIVGQRKLIELKTRTNAADVVNVIVTDVVQEGVQGGGAQAAVTNLDLDAAGEFALLEWTGSKWNVLYTNGTIA